MTFIVLRNKFPKDNTLLIKFIQLAETEKSSLDISNWMFQILLSHDLKYTAIHNS